MIEWLILPSIALHLIIAFSSMFENLEKFFFNVSVRLINCPNWFY